MDNDPKAMLHRYLRTARASLLWKLDGVSDYDVRRPLTPTGTNLLGIVKHLATVELGYFGDTFERPHGERFPWDDREQKPNEDMFARADETRGEILSLYERAAAHSDTTIDALSLDDEGDVPWWPDDVNPGTLHWIMVHMIAETNRHLGQIDILREGLDGHAGLRPNGSNLPEESQEWWAAYVADLEVAARTSAGLSPEPGNG
ncbi:MAG: DinB family protein [Ilumatobacter sp.]